MAILPGQAAAARDATTVSHTSSPAHCQLQVPATSILSSYTVACLSDCVLLIVDALACMDERIAIVNHSSLAFNHGVVLELVILAVGLAHQPDAQASWFEHLADAAMQEHVTAMFLLHLAQLS